VAPTSWRSKSGRKRPEPISAAALEGLAVDPAHEVDRHHVALGHRRVLGLFEQHRLALAQALELLVDVDARHLHAGLLGGQAREVRQLDRGLHLDARRVVEGLLRPRPARLDGRLRDGVEAGLLEGVGEGLGHQGLLDLLGERGPVEPLEHRAGCLARPEAAHADLAGELPVGAVEGLVDAAGVDLHLQAVDDGALLLALDPHLGGIAAHRVAHGDGHASPRCGGR
jgi:hypothetical protein